MIAKDPFFSYLYSTKVIKQRFELGEDVISKEQSCAQLYLLDHYLIGNIKTNYTDTMGNFLNNDYDPTMLKNLFGFLFRAE